MVKLLQVLLVLVIAFGFTGMARGEESESNVQFGFFGGGGMNEYWTAGLYMRNKPNYMNFVKSEWFHKNISSTLRFTGMGLRSKNLDSLTMLFAGIGYQSSLRRPIYVGIDAEIGAGFNGFGFIPRAYIGIRTPLLKGSYGAGFLFLEISPGTGIITNMDELEIPAFATATIGIGAFSF